MLPGCATPPDPRGRAETPSSRTNVPQGHGADAVFRRARTGRAEAGACRTAARTRSRVRVRLLTRLDAHRQDVLLRGEGAGRVGRERARRVVSAVEVQDDLAVHGEGRGEVARGGAR